MTWPDDYIPTGFTPFHVEEAGIIFNCDCREILPKLPKKCALVVTDPPFNIRYHYHNFSDNLPPHEYKTLIMTACSLPSVIIHYPEDMFIISEYLNCILYKCVSWIYNANTPKQHRMVAWFGINPDFSLVKQEYKNLKDKRINKLIYKNNTGSNLYDWWFVNQVKNISKEKTIHPCQMPLEVMRYIISITPSNIILDPFLGSGTTAVAAKELGRRFIGIEIEEKYCQIAVKRLRQGVLNFK